MTETRGTNAPKAPPPKEPVLKERQKPREQRYHPERKNEQGSPILIPFIFLGFLLGLGSTLAAPIVYGMQVVAYNKKNEWPGWSGLDALNHFFYQDYPLFFYNGVLYNAAKVKVVEFKGLEGLTKFANAVVYGYLDMSIVLICLLNGLVLLTFSIRAAIFRLNKEGD